VNKYTKALMAALGALVTFIETTHPVTASQWAPGVYASIGTGLAVWFVPNTTASEVIPPAVVVPPKAP
jgi:hypothetical protein